MNIACFDKNIDMDWVVECAHVANIHDDIINMPMGYGTIIGGTGPRFVWRAETKNITGKILI